MPLPHRYGFLGTQFRDMDQLTIHYDKLKDAKLIWGRLDDKNRAKADQFLAAKDGFPRGQNMIELIENWNGRSYNSTCCCLDLWAALFSCCRLMQNCYGKCIPAVKNNGSQFCSEFTANLYKELGILDQSVCAKKVVPADYLVTRNEAGEIVSMDVEGEVPILFRSYVNFTARSKAGKKVNLAQHFFDRLQIDEHLTDETKITPGDVERTSINLGLPLAGAQSGVRPTQEQISACPYPVTNQPMPFAGQ